MLPTKVTLMIHRIVLLTSLPILAAVLIAWGQHGRSTAANNDRPPGNGIVDSSRSGPVAKARGQSGSALAPVTVSETFPTRQDVPVYAVGLGTVQASLTIGIHSQVDGKLDSVLFTEGQYVKKGDVLARIDPRLFQAALDAARAKRAQDAALLLAAQKDLERFLTLATKNFQSQQSIDQQKAKVDQLAATIAADDAAIETAQTQLDYTTITAPHDGRVGVRLVDPGNIVRASDPGNIATLMQTKPSSVMFTLPSQLLSGVRKALARGPVEVVAFDQDNREQLAVGGLLLIDNAIDQATATIRLKALFANDDERLWPGQFVNARVLVDTASNALTVPRTAIQRGPKGVFVWVIDTDNLAAARPVELGPTTDTLAVVTAGVSETDRVVVGGQYKLQVGAPVVSAPASSRASQQGDRT